MKIQPVEKRRPKRIAAGCQREMMVILRDDLNGETAQWLDVDDVETDHDKVQQQQSATSATVNIIGNIQEWTDTPCNGKTCDRQWRYFALLASLRIDFVHIARLLSVSVHCCSEYNERYCNIKVVISFHNMHPIIMFKLLESRYRNQHFCWCHIWGRGGWIVMKIDDEGGGGLKMAKLLMT